MPQFKIPFQISGHMLVEAPSHLVAASKATGLVRSATNFLDATGETQYRCPFGQVVKIGKTADAR